MQRPNRNRGVPRLLALLAAAFVPPVQTAVKPNFLLILVDDLGYSDLGCYGAKGLTTNASSAKPTRNSSHPGYGNAALSTRQVD